MVGPSKAEVDGGRVRVERMMVGLRMEEGGG